MIRPNRNAKGKVTSYGVRVHIGNGRWRWIGSFKTKAEAVQAEARALLDRDSAGPVRLRGGQLVDWYLDWYQRNRKDSSYDAARAALGAFRDDFSHRTVKSITKQQAEEWARGNRWRVPAVVTMFNRATKRHADRSHRKSRSALRSLVGSTTGTVRRNAKGLLVLQVDGGWQYAFPLPSELPFASDRDETETSEGAA